MKRSALRSRELAQQTRALRAPQHDYDGKGPISKAPYNNGAARRMADLIRYAAALGRHRKQLPDDLSSHNAFAVYGDDGTATVHFTPVEIAGGRFGKQTTSPIGPPIVVELRNLDWVPAEPVEELIEERIAA